MRPAAGLLLALCAGLACAPVAGPEIAIASALRRCADRPAACPSSGGLVLRRVRFDRLLVKPEDGGYVAVSTVDLEGVFGGAVEVSYLGLERIPFRRAGREVAPAAALLPTLEEIAQLLTARTDALARGDVAALEALVSRSWSDPRMSREAMLEGVRARVGDGQPTPQARQWSVRADRQGAEVLEEYTAGDTGPRRSRFVLRRDEGRLRFASGLL